MALTAEDKQITEAYRDVIRRCPLFADAADSEIAVFLHLLAYSFSPYRKGDFLLHTTEEFTRFGLVVYGRVKVMIDDIEGNSAMMAEVTPGITFGESLCFSGRSSGGIYALAAEDTGVIWLSPRNLFYGSDSAPVRELERRFAVMLAARTLAMNNRIQILSKLTLRNKIITFLTLAQKNAAEKTIEVSLSRDEMAVYFGTNRSALSRELSRMKQDGLIDYNKNRFQIKF